MKAVNTMGTVMTIWKTERCARCDFLIRMVERKGITPEVKLIDEDTADRFRSLGISAVPILEVGGKYLNYAEAITLTQSITHPRR